MDKETIKQTVSDVMSDFYNQVLKPRLDHQDKVHSQIQLDITDIKLSHEALVKIVDYSRLEARVLQLEKELAKTESLEERIIKLEKHSIRVARPGK